MCDVKKMSDRELLELIESASKELRNRYLWLKGALSQIKEYIEKVPD